MATGLQRKYMEALRDMIEAKGRFSLEDIRTKHRISYTSPVLRKFGWIAVTGEGTTWIGPKPHSEEELFRLATIVRTALSDQWRSKYAEQAKKNGRELKVRGMRESNPAKTVSQAVKPIAKCDPSDSEHQRYMDAISFMSGQEDGFVMGLISWEFKISSVVPQVMKAISWVRKHGNKTAWCGPSIRNGKDLAKAARFLMDRVEEFKASIPKADERVQIEIMKPDSPLQEFFNVVPKSSAVEAPPAPIVAPPKAKIDHRVPPNMDAIDERVEKLNGSTSEHGAEVSILWGLFKWKRA